MFLECINIKRCGEQNPDDVLPGFERTQCKKCAICGSETEDNDQICENCMKEVVKPD